MQLHKLVLVSIALVALAMPAAPALHSAGNGVFTTDSGARSFYVPLSTAIWWDHTNIRGVPTGLQEQTHALEIRNPGGPVTVTAETFPRNTPDTPKVCLPTSTPGVVVPAVVLHPTQCVKDNGYSVQIHFFPWTNEAADPDHVISPTPATPLATTVWRVDAVPTSFKTAVLDPGHWQVWIDPAVSIGEHDVVYRATSATPFYFDYLGTRGCVFYFNVGGQTDTSLLGCPSGYI